MSILTPARRKFLNTLSELDLPFCIWLIIVEYSTARKKEYVLRDITQIGFCRDFLGYRHVAVLKANIKFLNLITGGPIVRIYPSIAHRHYGQDQSTYQVSSR